jgi:hypothetical protein
MKCNGISARIDQIFGNGMQVFMEKQSDPLFRHIRDIPYSLAVPMTDPKTAPRINPYKLLRIFYGKRPRNDLLKKNYRNIVNV